MFGRIISTTQTQSPTYDFDFGIVLADDGCEYVFNGTEGFTEALMPVFFDLADGPKAKYATNLRAAIATPSTSPQGYPTFTFTDPGA